MRLALFLGFAVLLSACGGRQVRVAAPQPPPAGAELEGLASYYAEPYHGRRTANGEVFDTYQGLTAAHRTLPFNTVVRVRNKTNNREVDVRINDRGPFIDGRVIDLSLRAAREIDMVRAGVVPVELRILQAAAAPPARPASSAVYVVQVAAFENPSAAESLRRDLESRYSDVIVQSYTAEKTFYRVRVGRSSDLQTAEQIARQLRQERFEPFVVRLD